MSDHRHVLVLDQPPRLRRDIRRNLRAGSAALARDRHRGQVRFTACPAELAALRPEITAAWEARNLDRGRDTRWEEWDATWGQVREAGTLRVGGKLAAWVLADPAPPAYRVLAGQLAPGGEPYRAGRLLEHALIGRVLTGQAWQLIDWGSGHPEALIAVTA